MKSNSTPFPISRAIVYAGILSILILALAAFFRNNINTRQEYYLFCDGNSLMEGTVLEEGQSIGDQIYKQLKATPKAKVMYKNVAKGGSNIFYQDSLAKVNIDPYLTKNKSLELLKFKPSPKEIIIVLAGTNEIKKKGDGYNCYQGYLKYANNRHKVSNSAIVCLVTCPDAKCDYLNASEREILNEKLRATEETEWLKIVDINARVFDRKGACGNDFIYTKDSIHFNKTGSAIFAQIASTQVLENITKSKSNVNIQEKEYYYVKNSDAGKIINMAFQGERLVYLPDAHKFPSGVIVGIKDAAGTAKDNRILIKSSCAQRIDNKENNTISENFFYRSFYSDGFQWFVQKY